MKGKKIRKGFVALFLVAAMMMSSMTVLAEGVPTSGASASIKLNIQIVMDAKEVEGASAELEMEKGYVLEAEDLEDLYSIYSPEEKQTVKGLYWDAAGTKAVKAGDVLDTDASLYLLVKTQEDTPSPTPNPNPTPNPGQTPEPTPAPEPEQVPNAPRTGDAATPVGAYFVILAAAAVAVGGVRRRVVG